MDEGAHVPVLVREVVAALSPRPGETYVDATSGDGGHAAAIAPRLGPAGCVILSDIDPSRLEFASDRVGRACPDAPPRIDSMCANFAELPERLSAIGVRADMLLADLGFSSVQMAQAQRGLSFDRDGPLDMRLNPASPVTAGDLVRDLPVAELARILSEYGEERFSRRIAEKIVAARTDCPIKTTGQLAAIVRSAIPRATWGRIDPATRTFQALRIAVNDELGNLGALLACVEKDARELTGGTWLAPGARAAVISFHSLEDRMVKRSFADLVHRGLARHVAPSPIRASEQELTCNPRARSATLRVLALGG